MDTGKRNTGKRKQQGSQPNPSAIGLPADDPAAVEKDTDRGLVVQLQHFSLHDGEGIRTTLFLAGCPLRCRWCANPESWELTPLDDPETGKPLRRWMSLEEILGEVRRQMVFYRASGGGITYSGGEPTLQLGFLRKLAAAMGRLGIDQAMETCGCFSWEETADVLRQMDTIFVDLKMMDPVRHQALTGSDNGPILENIRRMARLPVSLIIRIPLIPGVNDSEENLKATAGFLLHQAPGSRVEVLPYHSLGLEKYDRLGLQAHKHLYRTPVPRELERAVRVFEAAGVPLISYQ